MSKGRTSDFADFAVTNRLRRDDGTPADLRAIARSEAAQFRADQVELIRHRLGKSASGHLDRAAGKLIDSPSERLSDADYKTFADATGHAVRLANLDKELRTLERRYRSQVIEVKPVDPYAAGSPHSWICDALVAGDTSGFSPVGHRRDGGHEERLQRHGALVSRAIDRRSKYGKAIIAGMGEQFRQADVDQNRQVVEKRVGPEVRALATGGGATASAAGGSAAAFVAPAILMEAWAQYNSPAAVFISQCDNSVALPSFGMTCYVPIVTTGTTVATDTEGSGTAEGDPVTSFASGAIVEKAGQLTVSTATLERVGPGIAGDVMLWQQLKNQLAAAVDTYALVQVTSGAQTVTNSGSFAMTTTSGVGGFLKDLKTAKNLLHDTAGVRLRGSHCFAWGDFTDYIASYADAQGRPLFSPARDDNRQKLAEGQTGYVVAGLDLWADDLIATTGGTSSLNQIIVTKPSEILQLEAPPVQYLMPQGAAGSLEAILGVRQYCTTIAKYGSGVAVIGGTAYAGEQFV